MSSQEQIKKDIVDQLFWDNRVRADKVKVTVDDSKAKLTGTVSTYSEKISAADVARSVMGVSEVDNQILVNFPAEYSIPDDEDIQKSVEQSLFWSTDVDDSKIRVEVTEGMVTLTGEVPSLWQKISAEVEAQKIKGVVGLTNKLAVVPTEKITDEIIGERVMDRIDQNTIADVDQVNVEVEDSEVRISGSVDSWTAWRSVYDAAQYTLGVTKVNDDLVIDFV